MGLKDEKIAYKNRKRKYEDVIESDETFAFIAGYTSGGVPYGVAWEEIGEEKDVFEDEELPFK